MIVASSKRVLTSTVSRVALGPTHWVRMVLSLAVKWLVHETDLSPPEVVLGVRGA